MIAAWWMLWLATLLLIAIALDMARRVDAPLWVWLVLGTCAAGTMIPVVDMMVMG